MDLSARALFARDSALRVQHTASSDVAGRFGAPVEGARKLRPRTYLTGIYTHLLNRWDIVYDQPIVLNEARRAWQSVLLADPP